jgi:hypothetical protein
MPIGQTLASSNGTTTIYIVGDAAYLTLLMSRLALCVGCLVIAQEPDRIEDDGGYTWFGDYDHEQLCKRSFTRCAMSPELKVQMLSLLLPFVHNDSPDKSHTVGTLLSEDRVVLTWLERSAG